MDTGTPVDAPGPAFDRSLYPRRYRLRVGWQVFMVAVGLALLGAAGWVLRLGVARLQGSGSPWGWHFAGGIVLACLGVGAVVLTRATCLMLTADAIEIDRKHRLRRDEVKGWRILPTQQGVPLLIVEPRTVGQKPLRIGIMFRPDAALEAWFAGIPNLDALELGKSYGKVMAAERRRGETDEALARRFARMWTVTRWMARLAVALSLWAIVFPRPTLIVVAANLTLLLAATLVMARSGGAVRLQEKPNDAHPSVERSVVVPLLAVGIVGLRDVMAYHLLDWKAALVAAGCIALPLALAISAAAPDINERRWFLIVLFVASFGAGFGAFVSANRVLDRSPPQEFAAPISKVSVAPRGREPRCTLTLGAWGPHPGSTTAQRWSDDCARLPPNTSIQVLLHRGALGLRWYQVGPARRLGH